LQEHFGPEKEVDKSSREELEVLQFRGMPRRKVGRCVVQRENFYTYESGAGQMHKMHDSFGRDYQEFYLAEGPLGREAYYHYRAQHSHGRSY
jgi:hypothetical protein